jgi:nicotinamide mononucleotide transporter
MDIYHQFIYGIQETRWYEFVAVVFGIASVWLNRNENILVYPVGLVNTILYIVISLQSHLIGEASVNLYYTIVSIYGWILWARKDKSNHPVLHITWSTKKEWTGHLVFFASFYILFFFAISHIPVKAVADANASATGSTPGKNSFFKYERQKKIAT